VSADLRVRSSASRALTGTPSRLPHTIPLSAHRIDRVLFMGLVLDEDSPAAPY
jgi:hypothetical protein